MAKVLLYDDGMGIARISATGPNGTHWIEFEVDHFAEQTPGECSECGAEIEEGFLCLDDGSEVCHNCVDLRGYDAQIR